MLLPLATRYKNTERSYLRAYSCCRRGMCFHRSRRKTSCSHIPSNQWSTFSGDVRSVFVSVFHFCFFAKSGISSLYCARLLIMFSFFILFSTAVMATTVWVPSPRGLENPCPSLPKLHLLRHCCHAEVLRPHCQWYLWRRHRQVSITQCRFFQAHLSIRCHERGVFYCLAGPWSDRAVGSLISLVLSSRATWGGSGTPSRAWSGPRQRSLSRKSQSYEINMKQPAIMSL